MHHKIGETVGNLCRRLIYACVNGGVPVHLLDRIHSKAIGIENLFKSADFERVSLNFLKPLTGNVEIELTLPIFNLKNHLLVTTSEANLRSLFWDVAIIKLFHDSNENLALLKYRLESEWSSRTVYPESDDRFVDFVALIKPNIKEIPILLIEIGKESFDIEDSHKDFSKLLGLMSATCITMAQDLAIKKKIPELARVYGIWIGGSQFQLCVAHPVVTPTNDGRHQIHANLSFFPHWKYDILSSDDKIQTNVPSCPCCAPLNCEGFECLLSGKRNDLETLTGVAQSLDFSEIDLESFINETILESSEGAAPETESPSRIAVDDPKTTAVSTEPEKEKPATSVVVPKLFEGSLSVNALNKLKSFINCVKARINLLSSDASNNPNEDRNFKNQDGSSCIFVRSRPSSLKETPLKNKFDFKITESVSPTKKVSRKKKSKSELEIYWKLSIHHQIFPKVYNAVLVDDSHVDFEFEEMIPLVDFNDGIINEIVYSDNFFESLIKSTIFSVHCLYGLYILHESVEIIHSDISPSNILYSPLDEIWKLNDFDQSMEIEKSLITPRTAGTEGFISPESRESGLFTKASDVYSLGKVIQNVLYMILLRQFMECDRENEKVYERYISHFERAMNKMCSTNSKQRSTVLEALKHFCYILENSKAIQQTDDPILTSVKFIFDKEDHKQKELEIIESKLKTLELPPPRESSEIKKVKLFTDEESTNLIIKNLLQ